MFDNKLLISGENVDAIYINGKYQDETQPLNLDPQDIQYHQFWVEVSTTDNQNIKLHFNSLRDLLDFSKAYELK